MSFECKGKESKISNLVKIKINYIFLKILKKLPACQCRASVFHPWSLKFPYASGQLSPHATAAEACAPRTCALQQESSPHLVQGERSPWSKKDPAHPKIKKKF